MFNFSCFTRRQLNTKNCQIKGFLWDPKLQPLPSNVTVETVDCFSLVHLFLDVLLSASENCFFYYFFVINFYPSG
jgi:hypothetical protein